MRFAIQSDGGRSTTGCLFSHEGQSALEAILPLWFGVANLGVACWLLTLALSPSGWTILKKKNEQGQDLSLSQINIGSTGCRLLQIRRCSNDRTYNIGLQKSFKTVLVPAVQLHKSQISFCLSLMSVSHTTILSGRNGFHYWPYKQSVRVRPHTRLLLLAW